LTGTPAAMILRAFSSVISVFSRTRISPVAAEVVLGSFVSASSSL